MAMMIEQLDFAYGKTVVLRDVTATAQPGRITIVLGPNASGKSTLLRCMIGALRPIRGQVKLDEVPANQLSPRQLAQRIAYVPQRSIVSAAFTVRQIVELGRYALSPNSARVNAAIARLDLEAVADRAYPTLSVGQQQRVTLARAIAQLEGNGHLILDEPTSAMDLRHVSACMKLLRELASGGATIVMAMHDLSLVSHIGDDAWLLADGALVASGPLKEVLTKQRLEQVFGVGFEWVSNSGGVQRLVPQSPLLG
jgi:iron complex transport system ATP-binding protein